MTYILNNFFIHPVELTEIDMADLSKFLNLICFISNPPKNAIPWSCVIKKFDRQVFQN